MTGRGALSARLSAWWLAWKWVVILAALLAGSAWLNVMQWKRAIAAPLRAENRELRELAERTEALARDATKDNLALIADLDGIVERGRTVRIKYLKAATAAPLPAQCAPGAARVDAVNEALGPSDAHVGAKK